jgi:hypothetical protein
VSTRTLYTPLYGGGVSGAASIALWLLMTVRASLRQEFTVRYNPSGPLAAPVVATLVIDQEDNWKWTYKITGRT